MRFWIIFAAYLISESILVSCDKPYLEPYSLSWRNTVLAVAGIGLLADGFELFIRWRGSKKFSTRVQMEASNQHHE